MKRVVLLSMVAFTLVVAQVAEASTIQLAIRSGAPWTIGGMDGPPLCGVPGRDRTAEAL